MLLVGVPVGLWLLSGPPPYPSGLPTGGSDRALDVDALLVVMRLVVWLAWLQFAVCVVVEAASAVRGHGLPRAVPLSGFSQQLARGLVGALLVGGVLAGGSSGAVAASMPTQDAGAPAATAVQLDRADAGSAHAGGGEQVRDARGCPEGAAEQRLRPARGVPEDMTDVVGKKVYVVQPPKALPRQPLGHRRAAPRGRPPVAGDLRPQRPARAARRQAGSSSAGWSSPAGCS